MRRMVPAAGSVAVLAALAAATVSASFGLFNATTSTQTETVAAGKVTLTSDVAGACSVANLLPGTAVTPSCTLVATYSGNVGAYLGLNVLIKTQPGAGGLRLYNPADAAGALQVTISDNQSPPVPYTVPATPTACPDTAPNQMCYEVDNLLVSKAQFAAGETVTFTTSVSLPAGSATGYQGGAAQVILSAHAVQSRNNGATDSCTPGQACPAVSWS